MAQISIVIPVHNGEKFLTQCLSCIREQTYTDFEVICIDDASTDESLEIIQQFQNIDSRFQYVRNDTNLGAGESRNVGIEHSSAPYLLFLDGDDLYEPDFLKELYRAAIDFKADIALCEYDSFQQEEKIVSKLDLYDPFLQPYCEHSFCINQLNENGLLIWSSVAWNKLISRTLIDKYHIRFQSLHSSNDMYFTYSVMLLSDRIIHTKSHNRLIHYRTNNAHQISGNRNPFCVIEALKALRSRMIQCGIYQKYKTYYDMAVCFHVKYELLSCRQERAHLFKGYISKDQLHSVGMYQDELSQGVLPYYQCLLNHTDHLSQIFYHLILKNSLLKDNLFNNSILIGKKCAVWGCGMRAAEFISCAERCGCSIKVIIDNSEKKQNTYLNGIKVQSFESVYKDLEAVYILNSNYYGSIVKQIRDYNTNIRIIPVFSAIHFGGQIDSSLGDIYE